MSGMSEVPRRLRKGTLRGVWRWPVDASAEQLEAIGTALEWHTVVLDTTDVESKEAFLQACAETFALPSWFGMNWDALVDCLSDLDVGESMGILIGWRGWQSFALADAEEFATAVDVLGDASTRWENDKVPGAVVLVGETDGEEPDLRIL
ncbi:MAG: barstar family protein [Actinomycetes bacterium]